MYSVWIFAQGVEEKKRYRFFSIVFDIKIVMKVTNVFIGLFTCSNLFGEFSTLKVYKPRSVHFSVLRLPPPSISECETLITIDFLTKILLIINFVNSILIHIQVSLL